MVNAKKRSSQPEKSGENSAYAHKKSLFCYFLEKASMENHFGFCALKSPQTRMNTDKNRPAQMERMDTLDAASSAGTLPG